MRTRRGFIVLGVASVLAGCGGDETAGGNVVSHVPDFSVCQATPAVVYMPGLIATSTSGAFTATLLSAATDGSPPVEEPAIGLGTWTISLADATGGAPADLTLKAERPYMPLHGHGAATYPAVSPGDPGVFTVSAINFFMAGYWQVKLDLQPATGAADTITYSICIPQ